ncbi:MAG TPA: flavin reductase family protein [Micromonosporaceae bacterium]|nr:flavin reductase family protein [Micromonosporaceae bacterium]
MAHPFTQPSAGDALEDFRSFMARFPTGVAVVTTLDSAGIPRGMTCSSVCSVTLKPPTLLVCLRCGSPTLNAVLDRGLFAVNLLHERAQPVAQLFASGQPDRFDRVRWHAEPGAVPHLVDDAHAVADCRVSHTDLVGDHMVVFGEVQQVWQQPAPEPLLYGLRQYAAWPVA